MCLIWLKEGSLHTEQVHVSLTLRPNTYTFYSLSRPPYSKYVWFALRERKFDPDLINDLLQLKAALGLPDKEVAQVREGEGHFTVSN
jgi:hypothetical protein